VRPEDPVASGGEARRWLRLSAPRGALPLGGILCLIGVLVSALVGLLRLHRLPVTLCYFKALSGLPCLSCGSTRAAALLWALDPRGAFLMNPLAAVAAAVLLVWGAADLALMTRRRALRASLAPSVRPAARWVAGVALAANWIYLIAVGR
jgi:Protein of unknown function (DUF2752)